MSMYGPPESRTPARWPGEREDAAIGGGPVFTLTTGPAAAYPEVLAALSRPILYDVDPVFLAHYEGVAEMARLALGTASPPVVLHGEVVLGLEAAAAALIAPDDVVLNLVSGVYGKGFGLWARRYGREVVEVVSAFDEAIDPQAVRAALAARPDIAVVSLCHHDTPSGTLNPAEAIGEAVAAAGALLIVDAASSWAGMDVSPTGCRADVFVTGPNKCLGGTPGLTLLSVSDAAWAKMEANAAAPRGSVLSILDWRDAHRPDRPFPFTPSVAEINGLGAALARHLREGPSRVWDRHALTARACRAGVRAMGLDLWAAREEIASPTCTAVRLPEGIDEATLLAAARTGYGVGLSAGRGETAGRLVRIGHMGPTAEPMFAVIAVTALAGAMRAAGRRVDLGAGVEAAAAVIDMAASDMAAA